MPEYDDLPTLVGELKRAAIDAYMRTQHQPWSIVGDEYEMRSSGTVTTVTRPRADGRGGGDWSTNNFIADLFTGGSQDEKWGEAFDAIRSRIDAAVEPFLDLPDPDDIEPQVEKCRQVTRRLSGAAAASEGGQVGAGVIPGNLALVLENSSAMSGASIAAFKSRFVGQLGPAIGGHHGISIVIGSVLASEKGIWEAARRSAVEIVDAALGASRSLADSGSTPDWSAGLDVAGWAVKGAKLFFPGGKPVLEVVGLGIEIIDGSVAQDAEAVINGADAEAVLGDLERAFARLSDQITSEEELLEENLITNLGNVRNDRGSYDLSMPLVVNDDAGDVIAYTPGLIDEITQTYLPAIATELTSVATILNGVSLAPISRSGLGIAANGPGSAWYELRHLLWELLKDLAWEVGRGAENLDLVLRELEGHETGTSQQFAELVTELQDGSGHDPWN